MRAGLLRHKVILQRQAFVQNQLGENVADWITVATIFAQAQPLRGREFFASVNTQQLQSTDVRFRIRYRVGVTPSMRLIWESFAHDIQAVINVEGRSRELELMTVRRGIVLPAITQNYGDPAYFATDDYYATQQPQNYASSAGYFAADYAK